MSLDDTHTPVTVEGKTAVLIGATSGIGRAIALAFAAEGADVVATSRSAERVANTAEEIRERGAETMEVTCDATDREDVVALRDAVGEAFGSIDVLVYAPSYIAREPIDEVTDEQWDDVFDVQLKGAYRATQLFAEAMDEGSILHVASESARSAIPNLAAYSVAKGGLDTLVRVAAEELGPEIRVNAVRPGFVESEQTQGTYTEGEPRFETIRERTTQERLGRPAEIAGAAVYLASDAASYTTGEIVAVDDGFGAATFEE
ncbi:SDR family oxidoreductase [Halosimplex rubrum]|uniref:SDR family oxidoreductase n=1 Tax=Halosimplex rubrum TaxID=869889 RepID=A0A7D5NYM7_9EURY|nr:SDR family oxidoreductase [Halosimplex rubrum]QLH76546.1 SDR family oxidoreductase [Halosimplex rubrum]